MGREQAVSPFQRQQAENELRWSVASGWASPSSFRTTSVSRLMNSYPVHFVSQPRPLLFVAGLDHTPAASSSSSAQPPAADVNPSAASPAAASDDDAAFVNLSLRLRELFERQAGLNVWERESASPSTEAVAGQEPTVSATALGKQRERKEFRILLVDQDVRLPPPKVAAATPTSSSSGMASSTSSGSLASATSSHSHSHSLSAGVARSPLSPHTPTSPLYPDGLIAPVWLRKHTDLLPSNFVLFHRLSPSTSPLAGPGEDDALIVELSRRRRMLSERGIKLTVVLLASRDLLDSPSLDGRLSHLRRSATLDSRSSLFVLTPVSAEELAEFSASLQEVLWESALEYYALKERRAGRRKKARANEIRPGRALSTEGWRVRDEFKSGFWAEIRGDWETARKHYHQSYQALLSLFTSSHLHARTKRWAEAKVLSDALVLRLSRLSLYLRQAGQSAALVRAHVVAFARLGEGWGMRPGGWEWASWEGRQWRLLAELMEQAGPDISPLLGVPPMTAGTSLGVRVPAEVLWGREWYLYEAGRCAERREAAFRDELEAERAASGISRDGAGEERAGWANEKKVDHLQLIVELYTKAYTLLSASAQPHARLALHVAHRLAVAYSRAGSDELSRRFWERLGRGYEREGWGVSVGGLLGDEARRERGLGNDGSFESLWEGVGDGRVTQDKVLAFLRENDAPSAEPVVVATNPMAPVFEASAVFYLPQTHALSPVPFQLHVSLPDWLALDQLPVDSLRIALSDGSKLLVRHQEDGEETATTSGVRLVKIADGTEAATSLTWGQDARTLVVSGWTRIEQLGPISITEASLLLKVEGWAIELHLDPNPSPVRPLRRAPRWLSSFSPFCLIDMNRAEPHQTQVIAQPHLLDVHISHPSSAYLEEAHPVTISAVNRDTRTLDVWLDASIYPSEEHETNLITFGQETSSSLISKVYLGSLVAGASIERTLFLHADGTSGDRTLDFSFQTRLATTSVTERERPATEASVTDSVKPEERIRTLIIPCIRPLAVSFDMKRYPPLGPQRGLLELTEDDAESFEPSEEVLISARFEMLGPAAIIVESIGFVPHTVANARQTFSSLAAKTLANQPIRWEHGHSFSAICGFAIDTAIDGLDDDEDDLPLAALRHASPGSYEVAWRRPTTDGTPSEVSHSKFAVPSLFTIPSAIDREPEHLTALLSTESTRLTLMEPFSLRLTVHNTSTNFRSAAVQIQVDSSDAFAWAGPRSARLPLLLAGQSKVVHLRAAALRVGWLRLPRMRLWEVLSIESGEGGETQMREIPVRLERAGEPEAETTASLEVLVVPP